MELRNQARRLPGARHQGKGQGPPTLNNKDFNSNYPGVAKALSALPDETVIDGEVDALIFGYYEGGRLMYAARTRAGFTPASRAQLYRRFRPLEIKECPFANLPEARGGRWGQGLRFVALRQNKDAKNVRRER